ncbi:MAG: AAA family ATPase [Nitrospira sp.]
MTLSPDEQLQVLARIWDKGEDGYVFLPWILGTASSDIARKKSWKESRAFHWPSDRAAILEHLKARNGDELYFTPNTFLGEGRKADLTGEETVLYADLDEADPEYIEDELKPSIAWESSPGRYQAIWLLKGAYIGASERGGLNHRLSIHVDADPSGWDSTQLLRVPGRPNYKPAYRAANGGKPVQGRLLWCEPDRLYDPSWLDTFLPFIPTEEMVEDVEEEEISSIDRHLVWGRVRLKCSAKVREYLGMNSRDIEGSDHDRSEVLWQIHRDLADADCTIAEMIAIVRPTAWNKYAGRNNELTQLRSEAIKAKGQSTPANQEDTLESVADAATRPKALMWLAEVTAKPIPRPSWLINNIWARNSVGFISGEPKSYKSYFALDMALSVALGVPFLGDADRFRSKQGNVLYLQEEDSLPLVLNRLGQIIENRAPDRFWHGQLEACGGYPSNDDWDAQRHNWTLEWTPPVSPVPLALHVRTGFIASDPTWQSWLAEMVGEYKIDLVVIDTLSTASGPVEINDGVAMNTKILRPLKQISEQTGTAIAIVHHSSGKGDKSARSATKMIGSTALHAWVESGLYVKKDEPVSGQPTQVRVERENKLAEDIKFRVRVPRMFAHTKDGDDGDRQLWEPEVLDTWAEDTEQEIKAQREVENKPKAKYDGPGGKVAYHVIEKMPYPKKRPRLLDEIVQSYGQNRGNTLKQLQRAVESGILEGDEIDGWCGV